MHLVPLLTHILIRQKKKSKLANTKVRFGAGIVAHGIIAARFDNSPVALNSLLRFKARLDSLG